MEIVKTFWENWENVISMVNYGQGLSSGPENINRVILVITSKIQLKN